MKFIKLTDQKAGSILLPIVNIKMVTDTSAFTPQKGNPMPSENTRAIIWMEDGAALFVEDSVEEINTKLCILG